MAIIRLYINLVKAIHLQGQLAVRKGSRSNINTKTVLVTSHSAGTVKWANPKKITSRRKDIQKGGHSHDSYSFLHTLGNKKVVSQNPFALQHMLGLSFIQPRSKGVGRGLLSAQDSIYSEICSLGVCMKRSKEKLIQAVKEERLLSKGETSEEFKQCKEKKGQKIKKKRWWKVHF